jgi:hypothetical protein
VIGHKVRAALERRAAMEEAGRKTRRLFTPKQLRDEPPPEPTVAYCGRCGALRHANAEGKLPPHRCSA